MKRWEKLFPQATEEEILDQVEKRWDLSLPLPIPKFAPVCVCGCIDWHARLWLFWDRTGGGTLEHRVAYRCDVSLKCQDCGQVVIWGVPLPEAYIEFWGPRLDTQIDFRTAKRIFEAYEESDIDGNEWRETTDVPPLVRRF